MVTTKFHLKDSAFDCTDNRMRLYTHLQRRWWEQTVRGLPGHVHTHSSHPCLQVPETLLQSSQPLLPTAVWNINDPCLDGCSQHFGENIGTKCHYWFYYVTTGRNRLILSGPYHTNVCPPLKLKALWVEKLGVTYLQKCFRH